MNYDVEKPDIVDFYKHIVLREEAFYVSFPVIDILRCRYCGSCIQYCPEAALHFERSIPRIEIIADRCKACGECIKGCHVNYIAGKERLTGYILHGQSGRNHFTFGKSNDGHNYHLPLICELSCRIQPDSHVFCDLAPGTSGFVRMALKSTDVAAIITKPNRGWKRNIELVTGMLEEQAIPFGMVINKIKNEEGFVNEVHEYCLDNSIPLFGNIPYDAQLELGKTSNDAGFGDDLKAIFADIFNKIQSIANS